MKFLNKVSIFLTTTVIACSSCAYAEDATLASVFEKHHLNGTIVISSLDGEITYIHNDQRANQRLSPASTFKIPNSLIAIEEKVLSDENEIIRWDGEKRFFESWNRDHNLKSAFQESCLWFYQEIAKKVGKQKYAERLKAMNYGNHLAGPELTTFWLDENVGDLRISPMEQIAFLKNIYLKKFNVSERSYGILKNVMLEENRDDYKMYAKTGAATKDWVGHGWYVGYLEVKGQVWFFATNISVNGRPDLNMRKPLTLDCLQKKGIF